MYISFDVRHTSVANAHLIFALVRMEMFFGSFLNESASSQNLFGHPDVERCPFLRNINGATTFSFTSALPVAVRSVSMTFCTSSD